jgi:hypothetical protein
LYQTAYFCCIAKIKQVLTNWEVWGSLWLPEPASMKWLEPLISSAQCGLWLVTLTDTICTTTCWWIVSESWTSVDLFAFQFPIQFQELEQQWIKCRFRVQEFRAPIGNTTK